ncbi:C5 cytosine-specific DNA methylase superfamily protein [Acanthamoeba castellanii str. Neff]|uniref:tRNA (cytosine(38)-C(5))-methyltransferase n=1 Tax=Acanthamoeba castellanii (strain ATCC 30010 / Neff) TaxID=1257118 RepID=L8GD98_ACACF|nr:C5 cytosine-specific DNA methylase superfamily protein [Acanthamoeba castellanii str. Neff]ELR10839.1 C5 cytosine-specific DNA methylase superfamily protein [Acanthamoeba castellanii str. Neff]
MAEGSVSPALRALEFYSGVGGMHWAVGRAGLEQRVKVVGAYDLNDGANRTYRHNFPDTPRDLASLDVHEVEAHAADIWLMSPPSRSFAHLLGLLARLDRPPSYLLLENVYGFERSESRTQLVAALAQGGYRHQEFLLSPTQFGIPNQARRAPPPPPPLCTTTRLRYFLLAKRAPHSFAWAPLAVASSSTIDPLRFVPACAEQAATAADPAQPEPAAVAPLSDFLEPDDSLSVHAHRVPDALVWKKGLLFDIVGKEDMRSCCFTKAYARFVEGAGSVLRTGPPLVDGWADGATEDDIGGALLALGLRYFTPREVARLHGFPDSFGFPEGTGERQKYQQLGNSLNVLVVARLLRYLLLVGPSTRSHAA